MTEKRFDEWNELKKTIHTRNKQREYREGEVWWYFAGENIGREINGKGPIFIRPILIIRKYGKESFFGVPLSTKAQTGRWFSPLEVNRKPAVVLLSQAGSFSVNRLRGCLDRISGPELSRIREELSYLLFKK